MHTTQLKTAFIDVSERFEQQLLKILAYNLHLKFQNIDVAQNLLKHLEKYLFKG